MEKKTKVNKVVVLVDGGVAHVLRRPEDVKVIIIDADNLKSEGVLDSQISEQIKKACKLRSLEGRWYEEQTW